MSVKQERFWAIVVLIGLGLWLRLAHAQDVTDVPAGSTSAQEDSRAISAGSEDAIDTYAYLDCRGLLSNALARCQQATQGVYLDSSSMLVRVVALVAENSANGWVKATATNEYLAYLILPRSQYLRLKGCANSDTCDQAGRLTVFSASWSQVKASPRCSDFFGVPACASSEPPNAFYGVQP